MKIIEKVPDATFQRSFCFQVLNMRIVHSQCFLLLSAEMNHALQFSLLSLTYYIEVLANYIKTTNSPDW